jgi:hypothetical protein
MTKVMAGAPDSSGATGHRRKRCVGGWGAVLAVDLTADELIDRVAGVVVAVLLRR